MFPQFPYKTGIGNWLEEMIYVEEHLHKISLPYDKYYINCLSCSYKLSYFEASKSLIVDNNNIICPNCKDGRLRLKTRIIKNFIT
jgi:hypothetical protein